MQEQLQAIGLDLQDAHNILMNAAFGLNERMKNVARLYANEGMHSEHFREKCQQLNEQSAVIETLREEVKHLLALEKGYNSTFSKSPLSVAEELEQYPFDSQDPAWTDYQ